MYLWQTNSCKFSSGATKAKEILELILSDCYQKFSINADKYCFPSLHGEYIEQKTHINASSSYIFKLLELKAFLPHYEGDPCLMNSLTVRCTCKRM